MLLTGREVLELTKLRRGEFPHVGHHLLRPADPLLLVLAAMCQEFVMDSALIQDKVWSSSLSWGAWQVSALKHISD